ncbi:hypothetical protein [Sphingomonas sp. M1-B02]|uniref:hypothetical protein n=1 Tax=Sphingomonas sp. M1-B02 TaxID=3114300 RepID=UPI00223EDE50|nr:hypothetical protein [Sphingomonas sp. S6-11]UZK67378.1 hypothetical protein OKW87_05980 [Sphingomonas sp. S6-11]
MIRILTAAAAASILFAGPALARDAERVFTHEGVTYAYTATPKGDATILEGSASEGGKFRLTVRKGWVSGYAGNARVSFRAPKSAAPVTLAQR